MKMTSLKFTTLAMSVALVTGLASVSIAQAPAGSTPPIVIKAEVGTVEWVDEKIEAAEPTAAERKFDEIGWVTNITAAKKLAAEHNRPIFLFTHDGRMATGRC